VYMDERITPNREQKIGFRLRSMKNENGHA
jgi:hypothetical protein